MSESVRYAVKAIIIFASILILLLILSRHYVEAGEFATGVYLFSLRIKV